MKRIVWILLATAIAVGLVWLLLRGTPQAELVASIRGASVWWLLFAQVPIWLSFVTRIYRWCYIVRAVEPNASFRSMFSATQIAFMVNFTVGMRSGEFVRPLVLSRLTGIPFSKAFALNTLDRIADLIGLIVVLIVTLFALRNTGEWVFPANTMGNAEDFHLSGGYIANGAKGAIVFMAVLMGGLVLLYVKQVFMLKVTRRCIGLVSDRLAQWVCGLLQQFADGLHVFRSGADMAKATFFSLVTWACFLWAGVCFFKAFGISCPWYTVFVMQSLLAFFVSAPAVPGMLGQFHIPIVIALVLVAGVSPVTAKATAIVAHLGNLVPIILAGVVCLFLENMSLVSLTRESLEAQKKNQDDG